MPPSRMTPPHDRNGHSTQGHLDSTAAHGRRHLNSRLRVLAAGKLTGFTAPGGGEIQMRATIAALVQQGIDARPWRPWEESLASADVVHLFGSQPEHLSVVDSARRAGARVAISTIGWFDFGSCWREPWPLARRLAAAAKFTARATIPRLATWRRKLYHAADILMPNSNAEAAQLVRHFQVPVDRIHVVPNGADLRFAEASGDAFAAQFGCSGFVLYAGRVEPRKNQLGFLRAMKASELPIVVLGDAVPGHEAYLAQCHAEAGPQVRFIKRLDHDAELLASAYAAAGCLALASWYETPGLVALEAAMSGTPLVLPRGGSAREYFGPLAEYVSPDDGREICRAVETAVDHGRRPELAAFTQAHYSWRAAARATFEAYEKTL